MQVAAGGSTWKEAPGASPHLKVADPPLPVVA